MAGAIGKAPGGQALVELVVVAAVVLILLSATFGLTTVLRKQMKHNFAPATDLTSLDMNESVKALYKMVNEKTRFFPRESMVKALTQMKEEGWTETWQIKSSGKNEGVNLKREDKEITLVKIPEGVMGVYRED